MGARRLENDGSRNERNQELSREERLLSKFMDRLRNQSVLITGGTGSFGTAFCKLLCKTDVGEIRIFSRDEKKQDEMRHAYKDPRIDYYIGDVRDKNSLLKACEGVDYVFHAAALKQVPSCEFFPMEAYKTNVVGTENVIEACVSMQVRRVVVLSTDKAVYPINAMGISKAMAERLVIARARNSSKSETTVSLTRYGNVMASRGSVIPLFVEQILSGKPLTVTNRDMTRFMMTLDEAVELVLYAFEEATAGELMIHKAPSCTIGELADALKEIFGSDAEVKSIGTRHGEKLYETLLSQEESLRAREDGKFYRVMPDTRGLDYSKYFTEGELALDRQVDLNSMNARRMTRTEIREKLLSLEYIKAALER